MSSAARRKNIYIADGTVTVGETMYIYVAYSSGEIRAVQFDGDRAWESRHTRQCAAHTPEIAAELGQKRAWTAKGKAKARRALERFRRENPG